MLAILQLLVLFYMLAILGVIVLSWFPMAPDGAGRQLFELLRRITEPVLGPLRRAIPPVGGVFDLSPLIVLLVLSILYGALGG